MKWNDIWLSEMEISKALEQTGEMDHGLDWKVWRDVFCPVGEGILRPSSGVTGNCIKTQHPQPDTK